MSFKQGINFRDTSGFVANPVDHTAQWGAFNTAGAYPITSPQGTNYGWTSLGAGTAGSRFNMSTSVDPRLAGANSPRENGQLEVWRIDLPSPGDYILRAAFGSMGAPTSRGVGCDLYDNTTFVREICTRRLGAAYTAGTFIDATNVVRSSATDWVNNNATIVETFNSTVLHLHLQVNSWRALIAHFYVEKVDPFGVRITLHNGTLPVGELTNVQIALFDQENPENFSTPTYTSGSVTINSEGKLELDLSKVGNSNLAINDHGFLVVYKLDNVTHEKSSIFVGKVLIQSLIV